MTESRPTLLKRAGAMVEAKWFQNFITWMILLNALILGLETWPLAVSTAGGVLAVVDHLILAVFIVELAIKISVERWSFFKKGWNVFDFLVVTISVLAVGGTFAILRSLRILRVLRLLSVSRRLRRVVEALLDSLPGMGWIIAVMAVVFYVSAVMAVRLFGERFPDLFGSIPHAMYTLFQIMTLDGWSDELVRPVMGIYPWAWVFFLPFIILTSFAVLNLFIAIIVNSMQAIEEEEREEAARMAEEIVHKEGEAVIDEIRALRSEVRELKAELAGRKEG